MTRQTAILPSTPAGIPDETITDLETLGFSPDDLTKGTNLLTHGGIEVTQNVHLIGLPPLPKGADYINLRGFEPKPGDIPGEWTLFRGGVAATCIDLIALVKE